MSTTDLHYFLNDTDIDSDEYWGNLQDRLFYNSSSYYFFTETKLHEYYAKTTAKNYGFSRQTSLGILPYFGFTIDEPHTYKCFFSNIESLYINTWIALPIYLTGEKLRFEDELDTEIITIRIDQGNNLILSKVDNDDFTISIGDTFSISGQMDNSGSGDEAGSVPDVEILCKFIYVGSFPLIIFNYTDTTTEVPTTLTSTSICFPAGTKVETDQGLIDIDKINPAKNSINGDKVIAITASNSPNMRIVVLREGLISPNVPDKETIVTGWHKILYKGVMTIAGKIPGYIEIPYKGQIMYNVLLERHGTMRINNMTVETLYPGHPVAKYYRGLINLK